MALGNSHRGPTIRSAWRAKDSPPTASTTTKDGHRGSALRASYDGLEVSFRSYEGTLLAVRIGISESVPDP